jgi:hypothetical protein
MTTNVARGYSPGDKTEFGGAWRERMAAAAQDVRYLLSRGYDVSSAVTFVGNRFQLSTRQRMALTRGTVSRRQAQARREKELSSLSGVVYLDGFNTVITLEVALSGSLLLRCDDGTIRDIAGLHGSYRIVDKTPRAVELMLGELDAQGIDGVIVYLDQPVSNSGRLKSLIEELGANRRYEVSAELLTDVDRELGDKPQVVTSDGVILDACGGWYNLNRRIIEKCIPEAWIYPL